MRKGPLLWVAGLVAMLTMGLAGTQVTHADGTGTVKAVPLSVIPVLNEYQVNKSTSFYDLEMKPGQKTELQMELANTGSSPLKVKVQATAATTNTASRVDYTSTSTKYDATLAHPLPTLIRIPTAYQNITIPAQTTAKYHMPLTMPAKQFKGIILGALRITPIVKESKKAGINSTYGYNVAVRLSNGNTAKPDLKLGAVTADRQFNETYIGAVLQNTSAAILRNGKISTRVTKQGQNRTLKSMAVATASAAPNSHWTLKTPWGGTISPGDYTLHITYKSTDPVFDGTKIWRFSKNFHVSAIQAAQYNLASVHIPWWVYAILALILVLLIIVIWLLIRRRKGAKPHESQDNQ